MWQKMLQLQFAPNPQDVLRWMLAQGVEGTLRAYGGRPEEGMAAAREGAVRLTRWTNGLREADARGAARVLAVDLGQPVRLWRHACRMLTFFVPAELVQEVFPDPQAIHGRTLHDGMPLLPLAIGQVAALGQTMRGLDARQAQADIITCVRLLLAAFGKDARLAGNARAAGRAAMVAEVRRYVQANLHQAGLTPESVIQALRLPRPTVYRLFQHEGGLGAYIRQLRLRLAAEELARYPHLTVMEIAYGLGFGSASDFARAFRRAYDMPPQEFREQSVALARAGRPARLAAARRQAAHTCRTHSRSPAFFGVPERVMLTTTWLRALGAISVLIRGQVEAFVQPSCNPSDHDLHRSPQLSEAQGRTCRAVTVRAGAIRDEECVGRIVHQLRFDNLAVRQIDRARHMALREQGWTRTSSRIKPGVPLASALATSEQSVSN